MRHRNSGRKFDRNTSSRRAMFRNLAANLILHESMETTDAKAKEIRRVVERLITKAKRLGEVAYTPNDKLTVKDRARRLATERLISAYIPRIMTKTVAADTFERVDIVEKVFVDLSKRFATRAGATRAASKSVHVVAITLRSPRSSSLIPQSQPSVPPRPRKRRRP